MMSLSISYLSRVTVAEHDGIVRQIQTKLQASGITNEMFTQRVNDFVARVAEEDTAYRQSQKVGGKKASAASGNASSGSGSESGSGTGTTTPENPGNTGTGGDNTSGDNSGGTTPPGGDDDDPTVIPYKI